MARPQQVTDDEIVDVARAVFVERGPSASVSVIAERLGISAPAVFQRVGSKQALMKRALSSPLPPAALSLSTPPPCADPTTLRALLVDHLLALSEALTRVMPALITLRAAGHDARTALLGPGDATPTLAVRQLLTTWLTAARDPGGVCMPEPAVTAECLLGALESRVFHAHLERGPKHRRRLVDGDDRAFLTSLVAGLITDAQRPTQRSQA
jgi:AcrR family transcriptional regulator